MATERLAPDAILVQTNLSGAVTDIDDDPDSADGLWLTAPGSNNNTELRVSFPTPSGVLTTGSSNQNFRVQVRKTNHSTNPSLAIELWNNGSSVATLATGLTVSSTVGEVFQGSWDTTVLGSTDGTNVEVRLVGSVGGGSPGNRASVEVGAVEWNVDYTTLSPITGSGAITLGGLTVAGTGDVPRTGTGAVTLGALTVAGAGLVTPFLPDNAGLFYSPATWVVNGSSWAQTNNPGAYIRTRFTGTGIVMRVQRMDAFYNPSIFYQVDGGTITRVDLPAGTGTQDITMATGLSDTTHTLTVWSGATARGSVDRWTASLTNLVRIIHFDVSGANPALSQPTDIRTENWLVFGDSIVEGINALTDAYGRDSQYAAQVWPIQAAWALDAEIGVVGFVSQGWTNIGAGSVPVFHNPADTTAAGQTWRYQYTGETRSFTGIDAIVLNHGTNDAGPYIDSIEPRIQDFLATFTALYPAIQVYVALPFGGKWNDEMTATVREWRLLNPSALVNIIDIDAENNNATLFEDLDGDGVFGTTYTHDGIHPSYDGDGVDGHTAISTLFQSTYPGESVWTGADGGVTLGGLGVSGTGTLGAGTRTGTGAVTLGALTVAGAGLVPRTGTGAVTLGGLTATGTGLVPRTGTGAVTLGALATAGSGGTVTTGVGDITLGALTASGTGLVPRTGVGVAALAALTVDAGGVVLIGGLGTCALGPVTVTATGKVPRTGTGTVTLGALTAAGAGGQSQTPITGTGAITLGALGAGGTGNVPRTGVANILLGSFSFSSAGKVQVRGNGAAALGGLTVAGTGLVPRTGTGTVTFGALATFGYDERDAAGGEAYANNTIGTMIGITI